MLPKDRLSWLFVAIQAVLLGLLIFLPGDVAVPALAHLVGRALELIGALILFISIWNLRHALTVFPAPVQHGQLSTDGLYHWVRHPMYTGVLTLSLGMAMGSGQLHKYALVIALYALFYYKSQYEEILLVQKYPGYRVYAARTGRFIPQPWRHTR